MHRYVPSIHRAHVAPPYGAVSAGASLDLGIRAQVMALQTDAATLQLWGIAAMSEVQFCVQRAILMLVYR